MKVIYLPAADPDEYHHILGVPYHMSQETAKELAVSTLLNVQTKDLMGHGWGWSEIEEALIQKGFFVVEIIDGPCWDV